MQLNSLGSAAASAAVRCASRRTFAAWQSPNGWSISSARVTREGATHSARGGRAPLFFCMNPAKAVFPNPNYFPTTPLKLRVDEMIPFSVACRLHFPILEILLRLGAMNDASVPETAVHEYRKAITAENEIWPSEKRDAAAPTSYAVSAKNPY